MGCKVERQGARLCQSGKVPGDRVSPPPELMYGFGFNGELVFFHLPAGAPRVFLSEGLGARQGFFFFWPWRVEMGGSCCLHTRLAEGGAVKSEPGSCSDENLMQFQNPPRPSYPLAHS